MVSWPELVSTALRDFWPCLGCAFNTRHSGQLTKALSRNTAFNHLKIIGPPEWLIGLRGLKIRFCQIGDKPGHRPVTR
jgi:hypothetical protein